MKKILLFVLLIFLSSCIGDETKFIHGNLWKITSERGIESYIFATVHLYPKSEMKISEKAFSNLEKCKILVLEIDITDTLAYKKISNYEMPEYFKNASNAIISEYGYENLESMENELIQYATEKGVAITGLESADEMLEIMDRFDESEFSQSEMNHDKLIKVFKETFEVYKEENIKAVHDTMFNQKPKMMKLIVNERNQNWLDDITKLVEKDPTFIAVGMAHLGGKNGILNLLSEKGYELKRM